MKTKYIVICRAVCKEAINSSKELMTTRPSVVRGPFETREEAESYRDRVSNCDCQEDHFIMETRIG